MELTTTLLVLAGTLTGVSPVTSVDLVDAKVHAEEVKVLQTTILEPQTLETYVREYYKDTPILAEISKCESTFRQYDKKGNVIRGIVNKDDVGLMQINEHYHADTAEKLGYDLTTVDGNLAFGKYLYERDGSEPWSASSKCWSKSKGDVAKK